MPSLVALAEEQLALAKRLEAGLEQNNLALTSFERDTLELLPDDAQKLRRDLLDISHEFKQLLRGAKLAGSDICFSWTDQLILRIVWRYQLASAIPRDGSATFAEIAAASGLSESLVARTIRAAAPLNIFTEKELGHVRHTALSRLLAENEKYYNFIGLQLEDIGPASLRLIDAWQQYGEDSGEPNQSAFSLQNGGRSLFTVLTEDPIRARRFDLAMEYCVQEKDFNFSDIVRAFDWTKVDRPNARVVDLGGGYGQISQVLANCTQHLTFTVQDLPHVVRQGPEKTPADLAARISFQAHNFLDPQPVPDHPPDIFLISRCLHNWSDRHSAVILRALIPALKHGSRVLIWDSVLSAEPVRKLSEKTNLQQDFIMATIANGKDRSAGEFARVLELSDPRFKIIGVNTPQGCHLSMIEVLWETTASDDATGIQSQ